MSLFSNHNSAPYTNVVSTAYRTQFAERDHFLLDVREIIEYVEGRIPGAVNIPMSELELRVNEVPKDQPVVVVCAHGQRSIMCAEYLAELGYKDLYNLADGTVGWMMRGLPLER